MKIKFYTSFILVMILIFPGKSQMQYKTDQLYISPVLNIGLPMIVNQNNYGFSEMAYKLKFGGQAGLFLGYDNYLKYSFRLGLLVSQFGQSYSDNLLGVPHDKKVNLSYIHIPIVFKYVFGDTKGFDFDVLYKYVFGGFQLGYLYDAKVDWYRNNTETDFWDFVSYEGINPNLDDIEKIGVPENDKDFFSKMDFMLVGGMGLQYFVSRKISVFGELTANIGLRDINDPTWRFRNNKNEYSGSTNLYGGLGIGVNYYP
ncbi:MAG: outer membrane beta-barrel protein [Saprospiraceae bacterium]